MMTRTLLAIVALLLASCSVLEEARTAAIEAQRGVERLAAEYEAGKDEAKAIRDAYARGEITEAERDAAIEALRDQLQASLSNIRDSLQATGRAMEAIDPEALTKAILEGVREAAPLIPGGWGELIAAVLGLTGVGGAAYAVRKAKSEGDRAIEVTTGVPARLMAARPAPQGLDVQALLAAVARDTAASRAKAETVAADLGTAAVRRRAEV